MTHYCLACGGILSDTLFEIPELPLVDSFCAERNLSLSVPRFTTTLSQCKTCKTIQIASPPDTSNIYKSYIYESSSSPDLQGHFAEYAEFIYNLSGDSNVPILEIGTNDGLLLTQLTTKGFHNLAGIDPSPQTGKISIPNATIVNDFFNRESASRLPEKRFQFIIANNCFSHIPNLTDTLSLCRELLEPEGMVMIEVQSTLDLVEGVVFDYIYHEHYFYHTVTSFSELARLSGLELFSVKRVATKGGSYRLLVGHPNKHTKNGSVDYWIYRETVAKVHALETWGAMKAYLEEVRKTLRKFLSSHQGVIAGYGACATGTVFLSYMGIENDIDFIVDDNPKRQGLFSPGAGIPVVPPDACLEADACVVLAWRHSNHIGPKIRAFNVPYAIPLPEFSMNG